MRVMNEEVGAYGYMAKSIYISFNPNMKTLFTQTFMSKYLPYPKAKHTQYYTHYSGIRIPDAMEQVSGLHSIVCKSWRFGSIIESDPHS